MLIYDGNGNFSVQLARSERAEFASGDMWDGTDDEIRAACTGYIVYEGVYEVNEADSSSPTRSI